MNDAGTALVARPAVARVQAALRAAGSQAEILVLATTARSAEDAAASIGCPLGAIVKSLVFTVGGRPAMALVAGDRRCDTDALARTLGLAGKVARADADAVREATGFSIGGVAPLGHPAPLPIAIDTSLGRFERIYAAAGHPHCVFPATLAELARITAGHIADNVGV